MKKRKKTSKLTKKPNYLKIIIFIILALLIISIITMGIFSKKSKTTEEKNIVFIVSAMEGDNEIEVGRIYFLNNTKRDLVLTGSGPLVDKLKLTWDEMIKKPSLQYMFEKKEFKLFYVKNVMYIKIVHPEDEDYKNGVITYLQENHFYMSRAEDSYQIIETKTFSGIIFPENYNITPIVQEKRFTPSNDDIVKAEEILKKFLIEQKSPIYSKLSQYKQQYFGFINKDNEKIIFINAGIGFERFEEPNWKKDYVLVKDGGDNYFNIKVNLNQEKCFDFFVNGEA